VQNVGNDTGKRLDMHIFLLSEFYVVITGLTDDLVSDLRDKRGRLPLREAIRRRRRDDFLTG